MNKVQVYIETIERVLTYESEQPLSTGSIVRVPLCAPPDWRDELVRGEVIEQGAGAWDGPCRRIERVLRRGPERGAALLAQLLATIAGDLEGVKMYPDLLSTEPADYQIDVGERVCDLTLGRWRNIARNVSKACHQLVQDANL